jgi:polygalacturonase
MALSIRGSSDIAVEGLTLADSGGDGIYVAGGRARDHCRNIRIKDVVCDNNYRQGISVISVDGLLVENSVFRNTWGTPPSAGVDIEPDSPKERLRNIVFRDCRFEDNYGDGIEVYLAHQTRDSEEVSILFERCRVSTRRGTGIRVAKVGEGGVRGSVVFRDCVVDGSEGYGIKIQDKAASGARVRFERCELRNTALRRSYNGKFAPVWLQLLRPEMTSAPGGIDFVDCVVEDALRREIVAIDGGDWKDVNRGIALR